MHLSETVSIMLKVIILLSLYILLKISILYTEKPIELWPSVPQLLSCFISQVYRRTLSPRK